MKLPSILNRLRSISRPKKILLLLGCIVCFMAAFVVYSEQPGFCNSCHIMEPYYASWQASGHSNVNCLDCHLQPGFAGHVKGKINGLAQAVDCIVGRMGTKPTATVQDTSCLRSDCHSAEELLEDNIEYKTYKFTHAKHISKRPEDLRGINLTCGTCHSHFEGQEHFKVNTEACFTCHFLKSDQSRDRIAETRCQSCHNIPTEPVHQGPIEVDHADFVAYEASCEHSCHQKQILQPSHVPDGVCLNCHDYRMDSQADVAEMHQQHSAHEKVECFACHGDVPHISEPSVAMAGMLDCRSCHSDTHAVQRTIFVADKPVRQDELDKVLSPMFLSHVECTGCHVETATTSSGALDSLGKVAKATPQACDRCHEQGTGEKYIPFWQRQTKKLYENVNAKLTQIEHRDDIKDILGTLTLGLTDRLGDLVGPDADTETAVIEQYNQAKALLDAVVEDGSWGVHNLKYTEAMLAKAKDILRQIDEGVHDNEKPK